MWTAFYQGDIEDRKVDHGSLSWSWHAILPLKDLICHVVPQSKAGSSVKAAGSGTKNTFVNGPRTL